MLERVDDGADGLYTSSERQRDGPSWPPRLAAWCGHPLMQLACLSKPPSRPSALLVRRSRLAVHRLTVFGPLAYSAVTRSSAPSGFGPASECNPGIPAPYGAPLSRGLVPLQRNPASSSHHSRVCLALVKLRPRGSCPPRRFAPLLASLACLSQARSWGSFGLQARPLPRPRDPSALGGATRAPSPCHRTPRTRG